MTIVEKKEHILRCIKLGMDMYSAALVAECTEEEVEVIEKDPDFGRLIEVHSAIEERELLVKFDRAMDNELHIGKTNAIRWKLERMNPRRWGGRETSVSPREPNRRITINLIGRYPNDS